MTRRTSLRPQLTFGLVLTVVTVATVRIGVLVRLEPGSTNGGVSAGLYTGR
jgi:hypothetical protein